MKIQPWLLTIATIITMAAVCVYAFLTYKLHRGTERQLELFQKDISLSRTPRLSLGAHGDESAYINNIENLDDYSQSQIDTHIERMKKSGAKVFYTYRNISVNPAFQVRLISFNKTQGLYSWSLYTQNYISPGSARMDFLIGPGGEDIIKAKLIEDYGRDVITELKDEALLKSDRSGLYYILLYTDYNKNLYALRRIGDITPTRDENVFNLSFGIPEYYDLGPPK